MTKPMTVRLAYGKLHVAGPNRRGYTTICGRRLEGEDIVAYWGKQASRAWQLETQCLDCVRNVERARRRASPALGRHA